MRLLSLSIGFGMARERRDAPEPRRCTGACACQKIKRSPFFAPFRSARRSRSLGRHPGSAAMRHPTGTMAAGGATLIPPTPIDARIIPLPTGPTLSPSGGDGWRVTGSGHSACKDAVVAVFYRVRVRAGRRVEFDPSAEGNAEKHPHVTQIKEIPGVELPGGISAPNPDTRYALPATLYRALIGS